MDDWTELDDAYLEIFGEHPDLSRDAVLRRHGRRGGRLPRGGGPHAPANGLLIAGGAARAVSPAALVDRGPPGAVYWDADVSFPWVGF